MRLESPATAEPAGITCLPNELLNVVISQLHNQNLKSLRLSCTLFREIARPRIARVFISANKRNIEVLRAIAADEYYRRQVTEIIWDDCRLAAKTLEPSDDDYNSWWLTRPMDDGVPTWFALDQQRSVRLMYARDGGNQANRPDIMARAKQLDSQIPRQQAWEYYKDLVLQQRDVLAANADADAFMHALERFPSLSRVTVTPAAHGFLFMPLYETPMIRNFPCGFIYPIPQPSGTEWPGQIPETFEWNSAAEEKKDAWRGFRIVTQALAKDSIQHHVTELLLPTHHLVAAGLNCRIFDRPNPEYENLKEVLHRPGFKRLDLSLIVGFLGDPYKVSFRSGYFRKLLENVNQLEHFSLTTNVDEMCTERTDAESDPIDFHVPLDTLFPIYDWPHLRHFGLSGFLVTQADVLAFLATLPSTLRSLELSRLYFIDEGRYDSYFDLLEGMRQHLDWRRRPVDERPQVTIAVDAEKLPGQQCEGRAIWVKDEVQEFLCGDGPNPFDNEDRKRPTKGSAGTERDDFNPHYERPYADDDELLRLGILTNDPL